MTKQPTGSRATIYVRISQDSTGKGLGVERQLEDCRALAERHGLEVVNTFTDNDVSAYTGKPRPAYLAMVEAIRTGKVDTVLAWHEDRLHRSPRELEDYIEACQPGEVSTLFAQAGDLDLTTSSGRMTARIRGAVARQESEHKSERVTRAAAQRAASGEPNGSLGYGWEKVAGQWREEPAEAAVVREVVERLARRDTLLAVTADLNRRGVPSPESSLWERTPLDVREQRMRAGRKTPARTWGKTSVKKLALRQSNVADRVHHKGRPDEQVVTGSWPALVDRTDWEAARATLTAPGRRTNGASRPGARKHLLTWGIGECGVCGGRLRVVRKHPGRQGTSVQVLYLCAGDHGHECVGRNEEKVDQLVRAVVLERLSRPDALDWLMGDEDAARRATERTRELTGRLEEAGSLFAQGAITGAMLARITAELRPLIDEAEEERDRQVGSRDLAVLSELAGPAAEEAWDGLSIAQRRAVLMVLGMRVIIDRARRGPRFDPETVRFLWRTA